MAKQSKLVWLKKWKHIRKVQGMRSKLFRPFRLCIHMDRSLLSYRTILKTSKLHLIRGISKISESLWATAVWWHPRCASFHIRSSGVDGSDGMRRPISKGTCSTVEHACPSYFACCLGPKASQLLHLIWLLCLKGKQRVHSLLRWLIMCRKFYPMKKTQKYWNEKKSRAKSHSKM